MKGHIRQRGKDTWAIVIYLGMENGKKRQKWVTVHGSKKDAERELRRLLHEMDTGSFVEPSKLTVAEYLERWLNEYASAQVTPGTFDRYRGIVRNHFIPLLGRIPLTKLKPIDIQKAYAESLERGRRGGGPLSPNTVGTHHLVLHSALETAVRWELIARNPADAVTPPRKQRKEMQVLDEEGVLDLLSRAKTNRYYLPFVVGVMTGLRRGEILALRWSDVDLDAGTATVVRSLTEVRGRLVFGQPKSAKGRRTVKLLPDVTSALKRHRAAQAETRLMYGPEYHDGDLIFCLPNGDPIRPSRLTGAFRYLVKKAGLRLRLHDLRHTHATLLLRQGVNPKIVSERLGHATVGLTLDTYSHVLPDMQDGAVQLLQDAFDKAKKKRAK